MFTGRADCIDNKEFWIHMHGPVPSIFSKIAENLGTIKA